ncbi:hypothetical protein CLOP_g22365 [Closterium sp. NIES-67]|nr:hypothetical protein CLOP_g22365 [Closterium sp. NIES-67]
MFLGGRGMGVTERERGGGVGGGRREGWGEGRGGRVGGETEGEAEREEEGEGGVEREGRWGGASFSFQVGIVLISSGMVQ